jgi:hypothetical protein
VADAVESAPVGPGVPDDEVGFGEVPADGSRFGLVEANGDDGDDEADELAQPTRRTAHSSDGARILSIRGVSTTTTVTLWVAFRYGVTCRLQADDGSHTSRSKASAADGSSAAWSSSVTTLTTGDRCHGAIKTRVGK